MRHVLKASLSLARCWSRFERCCRALRLVRRWENIQRQWMCWRRWGASALHRSRQPETVVVGRPDSVLPSALASDLIDFVGGTRVLQHFPHKFTGHPDQKAG